MLKALKQLARPTYRTLQNVLNAYRLPTGLSSQLSPHSLERVPMKMQGESSAPPAEDLYKVWLQIPEGHKWWHYFSEYERVLGSMRSTPIRLLEVGVYKGGSLAMWKRYLHPDSVIVGLDLNPECARFDRPEEHVHVRIGDQSDMSFLRAVADEFGPFDVVIDDGSHVCSHMIKTFDYLFLNGLKDNGVFIAEDTHSNFWPGYRDQRYSFIDLCKDLVDLSHAHYFDHRGLDAFTLGAPNRVKEISVSRLGAQIAEIRFLDSMVVIQRKADRPLPTVQHL